METLSSLDVAQHWPTSIILYNAKKIGQKSAFKTHLWQMKIKLWKVNFRESNVPRLWKESICRAAAIRHNQLKEEFWKLSCKATGRKKWKKLLCIPKCCRSPVSPWRMNGMWWITIPKQRQVPARPLSYLGQHLHKLQVSKRSKVNGSKNLRFKKYLDNHLSI